MIRYAIRLSVIAMVLSGFAGLVVSAGRAHGNQSQEKQFAVTGVVVDQVGAVFSTAEVVFQGDSGTVVGHTDASGSVHVNLKAGKYVVTVSARGFLTTKLADFSVPRPTTDSFRVVLQVNPIQLRADRMYTAPEVPTEPAPQSRTIIEHVPAQSSLQEAKGSVCVAARADDPFWKEPATLPNGQINSHGLRVKIDKTPAVAWPDRKSLRIDGLNTSEGHVLAVLGADGKPIESVRFKFSEYKSAALCMNYDGYQGISLQEATRRTPWCKCH